MLQGEATNKEKDNSKQEIVVEKYIKPRPQKTPSKGRKNSRASKERENNKETPKATGKEGGKGNKNKSKGKKEEKKDFLSPKMIIIGIVSLSVVGLSLLILPKLL
jgi:hypothetical protein